MTIIDEILDAMYADLPFVSDAERALDVLQDKLAATSAAPSQRKTAGRSRRFFLIRPNTILPEYSLPKVSL